MYLNYFGLKEKPFPLSADPKFLYYSPNHKEALARMMYMLSEESGFMLLSGEVGTGKTLLINTLIRRLPEEYNVANIFHTALNPDGLIQHISRDFHIDSKNANKADQVLKIHDFLKKSYYNGKKSILIVDEAQNLSRDTFEEIRLLSNLESSNSNFLKIYLIGQPELVEKLLQKDMRQLWDRIGLKFQLQKLDEKETGLYIHHRLGIAGKSNGKGLFPAATISRIHELSEGIPRRINTICDNALLMCYANNLARIDTEIVNKVASLTNKDDLPKPEEAPKPVKEKKVAQNQKAVKKNKNTSPPSRIRLTAQSKPDPAEPRNYPRLSFKTGYSFEDQMDDYFKKNGLYVFKKPSIAKTIFWFTVLFILFILASFAGIELAVYFDVLV